MLKDSSPHFKGKDPLAHVVEAQKDGIVSRSEIHGQEAYGSLIAFVDTMRDTIMFCLFVYLPLFLYNIPQLSHLKLILVLGCGWVVWKTGRSALLGWSRLERLHRIVEQEKWEIEHHRDQERAELTELYRAKGFKDKLLEDVIEVFMSDGDRLLKVMIEEELGLSLESQEHPLKQAFGALIGGIFALVIFLFSIFFLSLPLVLTMSMCALAFCGFLTARSSNNEEVPTMIWHLGLGLLSFGVSYFLFIGL